jgi:uncharacterized protein (DUF924 family)
VNEDAERVLNFWIGPLDAAGEPAPGQSKRWYSKDPEFDARIRAEFGADLERAARGELDDWKSTPRGRLALVILLDQFSRNLHRGTAAAFANDARALALSREGISRGEDRTLAAVERQFLYMPLMHAEDREAQDLCVEVFRRASAELGGKLDGVIPYAERHREIVARFGRFPHRNEMLGRSSTAEEIEFLKEPGSSF